ncbi:MAG: class I SAM-dependent methyltransferase [Candidatus Omnitrophota bacterium]
MPEIKENNQSFYDSKWEEWNNMICSSPAPRLRRSKIISWLKGLSVTSLLDVGCGNGEFLREVQKVMPHVKLAGVDISSRIIEKNRSLMPGVEFYTIDLNNEILPNRFDVVVCMEVIEHCADYQNAIQRLMEMTGKWLFITVPCGPVFEIDRCVGHLRHFNAKDISTAVTNAGLRIVSLQCWGFPFFNLYKHAINIAPNKTIERFLSSKNYGMEQNVLSSLIYMTFKLCLPWWGYQMFVIASKK